MSLIRTKWVKRAYLRKLHHPRRSAGHLCTVASSKSRFVDLATVARIAFVVYAHKSRIVRRWGWHTVGEIDGFFLAGIDDVYAVLASNSGTTSGAITPVACTRAMVHRPMQAAIGWAALAVDIVGLHLFQLGLKRVDFRTMWVVIACKTICDLCIVMYFNSTHCSNTTKYFALYASIHMKYRWVSNFKIWRLLCFYLPTFFWESYYFRKQAEKKWKPLLLPYYITTCNASGDDEWCCWKKIHV